MGRVDVDAMLDELSPQKFDEWIAYYLLEPFGDQWRQSGSIAAMVHNAAMFQLAGGDPPEESLLTDEEFIPKFKKHSRRSKTTRKGRRLDPKLAEIEMRRRFGG